MQIIDLIEREYITKDKKENNLYPQFLKLIDEIRKKDLTKEVIQTINAEIEQLNTSNYSEKELVKLFKQKQTKIIKVLQKELNIVPINYYKNIWLAIGITAFGIPLGIAIGLSLKNIGLLAIGIPIGIAIGFGIGTRFDNKAKEEGRQLDVEIKF